MTKGIEYQDFPVTRFRGSKRKLLSWIYSSIKNVSYESALDAFGGSSSVSYLFKKLGKEVTYNDNLKFNSIIGTAMIENDKFVLSHDELNYFLKIVNGNSFSYTFISDRFTGLYFTDEENMFIDNYINVLRNFSFQEGGRYKKAILYYALFQACLIKRPYNLFHRANLNMRTKKVNRTFGNKVAWDRPFETYIKRFVIECNSIVFDNGKKCISSNKDAFKITNNYDLVYLDPPYIEDRLSESSDYLKCYHFLEGLARYSDWDNLIDYESSLLKITSDDVNNSLRNKNKFDLIDELAKIYRDSIIVFSYKVSSSSELEELAGIIGRYKKKVRVESIPYTYALSTKNSKECLILGI